jgi:hypothetical protein
MDYGAGLDPALRIFAFSPSLWMKKKEMAIAPTV